jgi:hypothetical protein
LALGACDEGGEQGETEGSTTGASETEGGDDGPQCDDVVSGQYANCMTEGNGPMAIDTSVCGSAEAVCITDNPQLPTAGVCAVDACEDACDCPLAPLSGNAPVSCSEVVAGAGKQCHLDCEDGQVCPDGMFCYGGYVCAWPKSDSGTPYGDCANNDAADACGPSQVCFEDNNEAPMFAVCAQQGCEEVSVCPAPPPTGNAVPSCAPLADGAPFACYLDCSNGETCPDNMVCHDERVCAFEVGMPGGDTGDTGGTGGGDTGGTGG